MSAWDERRALRYLLWLLARRDHGRVELERKLARKPAAPEVRQAALRKLDDWSLLDDERVARAFVHARRRRKGRLALHAEMARRGLPEAARDAALAPLSDEEQSRAAQDVLDKHAWRFASGDRRRDLAKAAGFLARRGFPTDAVRDALEARFGDADDGDEPDGDDPDGGGVRPARLPRGSS